MIPQSDTNAIFEGNVVAWAVQNTEQFWALSDRLGTHLFKSPPWDKLWPILYEGYKLHQTFPTLTELGSLTAKLNLDPLMRISYAAALRSAYTADVTAYTGAEVQAWVATKELQILGNKMSESDLSKFSLEQQLEFYQERIDRIGMLTGSKSLGPRIDLLGDLDKWWEGIEEEWGSDPITTGVYRLDRKLRDHGVRPILVLIVGSTGAGKSSLLKHTQFANVRQGGRCIDYILDDSPGEFKQRVVQAISRRFLTAEDYLPGNREKLGKVLMWERGQSYPGKIETFPVHPDKFNAQDFIRHLQDLQRVLRREDEMVLARGGKLPWGEPGKITMVSIDTGNQVRMDKAHSGKEWYGMERMVTALSAIPRLVKAPLFVTIQGDDSSVGAAQITLRNVGVSRGMARPAKLILGLSQTVKQSQSQVTLEFVGDKWKSNQANLWNVDFQTDRNTAWEPASLCILKNTMGSGDVGAGGVKNIMIPLFISYATSRIIENFDAPDELMRTPQQTQREEREAWSGEGGSKQPPDVSGKRGSK